MQRVYLAMRFLLARQGQDGDRFVVHGILASKTDGFDVSA